MAYGGRENIVFRNFRGIDPRRSGLYPEAFAPQDLIERGLVLDARNCRFSRGRIYWHRNQLRVVTGAGPCVSEMYTRITSAVRASNVVTCTTNVNHAWRVGDKVRIAYSYAFGIDGDFTVTGTPLANTFTFAQTGVDASSGALASCIATPELIMFALPYVTGEYDQLLVGTSFGHLFSATVDWSETPAQWEYGYKLFGAATWTLANTVLRQYPHGQVLWTDTDIIPPGGITGWAMMDGVLFACAGYSLTWPQGWPLCYWAGSEMHVVGFETPPSTFAGTADATGASNALVEGRYSYKVAVGNSGHESMGSEAVDVEVEYASATAYAEPKTSTTPPNHLDTITIDGITYRFTDKAIVDGGAFSSQPYDVICGWSVDPASDAWVTFRALQQTIADGNTDPTSGATIYTAPHPTVTAAWTAGLSSPRVTLTAREGGTGGNSIALSESTANARIHISGATFSGGSGACHIDLSSIPTGPPDATLRKLYRAFIASLEPGARGSDYNYLATIEDNTTTTYIDNSPQEDLGEPVAFDHAMPPRGGILEYHRDRLWMSGVILESQSYRTFFNIAAGPAGAVRAANVTTITTTAAHGFQVGDTVSVWGTASDTFWGEFTITHVPTTTSFKYANPEANMTDGGGECCVIRTTPDRNALYYSQLDEPWYWPAENVINVGSSSAILALLSWHDQLLVLKEDGAFLLTGYGESDWELTAIPGATGVIGRQAAASPYGVLWAGRGAWEFFDGQSVRTVLRYSELGEWTNEAEEISSPAQVDSDFSESEFPSVCWHDGRFYMLTAGRRACVCWDPTEDVWEVRDLPAHCIGLRAWNYGADHSHILAVLRWNDEATGTRNKQYLTALDSLYMPSNVPYGNYGDSAGSVDSTLYGAVRIELPPIVAEPGEMVRLLDVWVEGQWTAPVDSDDDLHLYVSTGRDVAWTDLGTVTQNSRLGVPAGYAGQRVRLKLEGANVPYFVLQAVTVEYQRRTARGA